MIPELEVVPGPFWFLDAATRGGLGGTEEEVPIAHCIECGACRASARCCRVACLFKQSSVKRYDRSQLRHAENHTRANEAGSMSLTFVSVDNTTSILLNAGLTRTKSCSIPSWHGQHEVPELCKIVKMKSPGNFWKIFVFALFWTKMLTQTMTFLLYILANANVYADFISSIWLPCVRLHARKPLYIEENVNQPARSKPGEAFAVPPSARHSTLIPVRITHKLRGVELDP